jgi:hypothetical protein
MKKVRPSKRYWMFFSISVSGALAILILVLLDLTASNLGVYGFAAGSMLVGFVGVLSEMEHDGREAKP